MADLAETDRLDQAGPMDLRAQLADELGFDVLEATLALAEQSAVDERWRQSFAVIDASATINAPAPLAERGVLLQCKIRKAQMQVLSEVGRGDHD